MVSKNCLRISKPKLNKLHTQVKQPIEKLKDWQEYIATPRKPLPILADAEYLVSQL